MKRLIKRQIPRNNESVCNTYYYGLEISYIIMLHSSGILVVWDFRLYCLKITRYYLRKNVTMTRFHLSR